MLLPVCVRIPIAVTLLLSLPPGTMAADENWLDSPQVVVELYTSQGCSSCPPADKLLVEMIGCEQILPLGFHVDYWDYLGWKDGFASKAFTARQKMYARAFRETMIYTPQVVVQGSESMVGSHATEVRQAIRKAGRHLSRDQIKLDLESMRLSGGRLHNDLALTLITFDPTLHHVDIQAGENQNRTVVYANVVTNLRQFELGPVRNKALAIPGEVSAWLANNDESVSVLVHDRDSMQIRTAWVRHKDPPASRSCERNLF